jgi:hypothetical protein
VRITLRSKPGEEEGETTETAAPPAPAAAPKPAPPSGSKTIPLSPAPAAPGAPPAGKPTVQLRTGAPATQSLPRATVQLQRTQPVSSAPPSAAVGAKLQTSSFELEEDEEPTGINAVAIAALVLSAILLIVTMLGGDKVGAFVKKGGSPSWGVPEDVNPFERSGGDFAGFLPEIPSRK